MNRYSDTDDNDNDHGLTNAWTPRIEHERWRDVRAHDFHNRLYDDEKPKRRNRTTTERKTGSTTKRGARRRPTDGATGAAIHSQPLSSPPLPTSARRINPQWHRRTTRKGASERDQLRTRGHTRFSGNNNSSSKKPYRSYNQQHYYVIIGYRYRAHSLTERQSLIVAAKRNSSTLEGPSN